MPTIIELEAKLKDAEANPKEFFGGDIDGVLRVLRVQSHPDKFSTEVDKTRADELTRLFAATAELATTATASDPGATDEHNPENPWQGKIRMGWMDIPMLKFAIANCGSKLDGLIVNHLDQLPPESLAVNGPAIVNQYDVPEYGFELEPVTESQLLKELNAICPVKIVSHGKTHLDRTDDGSIQ